MIAPILKMRLFDQSFNSIWIKYVTGFNPKYHCQKCLKGPLSQKFKYKRNIYSYPIEFEVYLNEYRSPYIYICGVTNDYNKNIHIAFKPVMNSEFEFENERIYLKVIHGFRLEIKNLNLPFPEEFTSCRNFQFGYQYFTIKNYGIL